MQGLKIIRSQITFLYYPDLGPIASFYEDIMGFELMEDQGYAKIYRVSGNAYLGIVAGDRFAHRIQANKDAVMFTLVVDNVSGWYDYLKGKGVKMLHELQDEEGVQVRSFLFEDPGGYSIEVQRFLNPGVAKLFHGDD